jgi:hypothetical protein
MGIFRVAVISQQLFLHEDASLPMQHFFHPRFIASDGGHEWMLKKGYVYQLRGETPTDLRMGVPAPTTIFDGMTVTMIETNRKAPSNMMTCGKLNTCGTCSRLRER